MTDAELRTLLSAEMARLADVVEAPPQSLPGFSPRDAAVPFVQVTNGEMHWVVVERGEELQRRSTHDQRQWLFWVFDSATRNMAWSWARENRLPYVDSRLPAFCRHLALLARLDAQWPLPNLDYYRNTLKRAPYDTADYPRGPETLAAIRFLTEQVRNSSAEDMAAADEIIRAYEHELPLSNAQEALATCALIAYGQNLQQNTPIETIRAHDIWVRRLLQ